jgi:hypothetical protein
MRAAPFYLLSFLLIGCTTPLPKKVVVDTSDGVDGSEAKAIASDYLAQHMTASFSHLGPYDDGEAWSFQIAGDAVPFPLPGIPRVYVGKSDGRVTWDATAPLKK